MAHFIVSRPARVYEKRRVITGSFSGPDAKARAELWAATYDGGKVHRTTKNLNPGESVPRYMEK